MSKPSIFCYEAQSVIFNVGSYFFFCICELNAEFFACFSEWCILSFTETQRVLRFGSGYFLNNSELHESGMTRFIANLTSLFMWQHSSKSYVDRKRAAYKRIQCWFMCFVWGRILQRRNEYLWPQHEKFKDLDEAQSMQDTTLHRGE